MIHYKEVYVYCRMVHMSGIYTYIQHLLTRCMEVLPDVGFHLIGNSSLPFELPKNAVFPKVLSHIYSIYEQN